MKNLKDTQDKVIQCLAKFKDETDRFKREREILESCRKCSSSVISLRNPVSVLLEDLEKVKTEAEVKELFEILRLGSTDVNDSCTQLIMDMSRIKTNLLT